MYGRSPDLAAGYVGVLPGRTPSFDDIVNTIGTGIGVLVTLLQRHATNAGLPVQLPEGRAELTGRRQPTA